MNKRPKVFSDLSGEDKADISKFHLAFQLAKRPNLTKEQREVILGAISTITPDTYNREDVEKRSKALQDTNILEQKAKSLFSKQEGFEIFASLAGNKDDAAAFIKYQNIIDIFSIPERKKAFRQLSPADMSNLWKIQMAYYLAIDNELNNVQKDFILRVIDFTKSSTYEISRESSEGIKLGEIIQGMKIEANELFTEQKALAIFSRLGFSGSCEIPRTNTTEMLARDCSCTSGDCSSSTICAGGGCDSTWFGCGFIYLQGCVGECRR